MSNTKTEKKPKKETTKNDSDLKIEVVSKVNIPKLQRRHTGVYAKVAEMLNKLDGEEAITLVVSTRPTAAGLQKFFKPLGYDVVSRSEKNKNGEVEIRVYISKPEATARAKKRTANKKDGEPAPEPKIKPPTEPTPGPTSESEQSPT